MSKNYSSTFVKAVLAGVMIAVAAIGYLSMESKYMGAVMFTLGLFSIYTLDFYLYTGKVGFMLEDKDLLKILVIWVGNFFGALTIGFLVLSTRLSESILVEHAVHYSEVKLGDSALSVFILACFCGLMMYIAAKAYKVTQNTRNSVGGYIGLFLCVFVFLLSGFEHSIANMFYFTVAQVWSVNTLFMVVVATLGNAVGGLFVPTMMLLVRDTHEEHNEKSIEIKKAS